MRVGVYVGEHDVQVGGGYTFVDEIVSGLRRLETEHEFLFLTHYSQSSKSDVSLTRKRPPASGLGRLQAKIARHLPQWVPLPSDEERLDRCIRDYHIELMYYPFPMFIRSVVPSVVTVWDLAHRLYPSFPEVSFDGWTWEEREAFYRKSLPRASAVITGTATGARQVEHHYGVHRNNVHVIPFPTPSYVLKSHPDHGLLSSLVDVNQRFVFYPAQFWPHKNHINLLYALKILNDDGMNIHLVLTGSDKGNLGYVREQTASLGLEGRVHLLGFVDRSVLISLYSACSVMVFPSFFGPDNLPPLEAMALGAPVIVADNDGARDQLEDAALYVPPASPDLIAQAIRSVLEDEALAESLREKGRKLACCRTTESYVRSLDGLFTDLGNIRRCWPS